MNINKNNYEAYFLDYHEGNLSPQEVTDLFLFLEGHPELKKELEEFENITLDDFHPAVFENKESLKKNITPDNREDYFIRAIENNLDANEWMLLQTFLTENPEFLKEFNLFKKTKLQADPSISFENKQELTQLAGQDQRLISAIEGLLTRTEQTQLEKELKLNTELKKEFTLYQYTKSSADSSILFSDKQKLKRKERKVIPLYYYATSAAAGIVLIIGLFFIFRTKTDVGKTVAERKNTTPVKTITTAPLQTKQTAAPTIAVHITTGEKKQTHKKNKRTQPPALIKTENPPVASDVKPVENSDVVIATPGTDLKQTPSNSVDPEAIEPKKTTAPLIAKADTEPAQSKAPEFTSISDLFASKLKEKLIGKDAAEKSNSSKLNGWDIAGFFAKGLTNLTGKRIAIEPKFNKDGEVTAYAFSAGKIEFSHIK